MDKKPIEVAIPVEEPAPAEDPKVELAKEFAKKIAPTQHATSYLEKSEVKTLLFLLLLDDLVPKESDDDISFTKLVEEYEQLSLSRDGKGIDAMIKIFSGAVHSLENELPSEMTPFELLKQKLGGLFQ